MYGKSQKYLTDDKWTDRGYLEKLDSSRGFQLFLFFFSLQNTCQDVWQKTEDAPGNGQR